MPFTVMNLKKMKLTAKERAFLHAITVYAGDGYNAAPITTIQTIAKLEGKELPPVLKNLRDKGAIILYVGITPKGQKLCSNQ